MKKIKKIKMSIYIIAVLWVAVLTQIGVQILIQDDGRITEAFANTNSNIVASNVEVAADYGSRYLSISDKEELVKHIATKIGINTDYKLIHNEGKKSTELKAEKNSKNGNVTIEIISIENDTVHNTKETSHYIIVNVDIYENSKSILKYKNILEEAMNELEVLDYQSIIRLNGVYTGKLTFEKKTEITNELLSNLEAKIVSESREDELYVVYGYTGLISEYIETEKNKVNINIAMTYDEEKDKTNIYLASPILNEDY